ncbi:MAG: YraN family protein [Candidatus Omnitrophota bacterium]
MTQKRLFIGKTGEDIAVEFLKKQGYKIIQRNFKSKLGELDIIASDKDTICFIEVKTRTSLEKGSGFESITRTKQHKLSKSALSYLKTHNLLNKPARFDVASILLEGSFNKIELIKNAFSLDSCYLY